MKNAWKWIIVLALAFGTVFSSYAEGRNYRNGRGGGNGPGNVGPGNGGGRGPGNGGGMRPGRGGGNGAGNVGPNRPNRPMPGPGNVGPNRPNRPQPGPGDFRPNRPNRPMPGPGHVGPNRPNRPQPGPGDFRPNRPNRPMPGPGHVGPNRPNRPMPGPGYGGRRPIPDRWVNHHRRYGHRDGWNFGRDYRYSRYNHAPYRNIPRGHYTYHSPRDFFRTIPYRHIYWNNWLRWRVNYANGYYWYNNYPWFVYNGYQHRYSDQDVCNYELVDGRSNQTLDTFYGQYCNVGYDRCSDARDAANYQVGEYRYFCSERVEDGDDYDWDYNDDFYSDIGNDDGYYNDEY